MDAAWAVGKVAHMTRCAEALSLHEDSHEAIQAALLELTERLEGRVPRLVMGFVSSHHTEACGSLSESVLERFPGCVLAAATAESIVGGGQEIEGTPALSLWAAADFPSRVEVRPFRIESDADDRACMRALSGDHSGEVDTTARTVLLLADPFTFPSHRLKAWNEVAPATRVFGGMASAAHAPGGNRLILNGGVYSEGAVGVALEGPVRIEGIVSQGCRPVGRTFLITRCDGNAILELGRRPALEVLQDLFESLPHEEQTLMRQGLHLGRVINEYQESFDLGDFLVGNVVGATESGGLVVTDAVRVGQTVQFHVRDAASAHEDLRELLTRSKPERAAGALLFTCNGRGTRLFREPNHDVSQVRSRCGEIPVSGFFAMGELGPIGGKNFVHGFTACVALFASE